MRRIIAAKAKRDNDVESGVVEKGGACGTTKLVLTTKWVVVHTHTHKNTHLLSNCFSSTSSSCAPFFFCGEMVAKPTNSCNQLQTSLRKWSFFGKKQRVRERGSENNGLLSKSRLH